MGLLYKIKVLATKWYYMRRHNCSTIGNKKDYCHTVEVVGEVVHTEANGWVNYGCPSATHWCLTNEIFTFDVMERYLCKEDYKLHFIFGFVHAEDAMAFKLGYKHVY